MKKVYSLVDTDSGCIIASSKTRRALEELMCDMFMLDFQDECQDAVNSHWINMDTPNRDTIQFIQDTWQCLSNYYNNYIKIERSELI